MKNQTIIAPLVLALAFIPFACSGDGDGDGDGDGTNQDGSQANGSSSNSDIDTGSNGQGGSTTANQGPRNGGTVELTTKEADDIAKAACSGWAGEGESIPAVLEFVVDVSGSMGDPAPGQAGTKWEVTHEALVEALDDLPASVAVGMLLYPNINRSLDANLSIKPVDYCVKTDSIVDVDLLNPSGSPQRSALKDTLNQAIVKGYTPTHDAYEYALENGLKKYQSAARKFMVLITDGAPTAAKGCSAIDGRTQMPTDPIVRSVAAAEKEGITTFIIGSPGSEEARNRDDMRPWLSKAAQVGGSASDGCSDNGPNYCHMDMSQEPDFAAALKKGLADIAGQVVDSCTFNVPEPPMGETIDPLKTNVIITRGDGSTILVLPDDEGDCTEGWQFNAEGQVILCESTCVDIKNDPKATLSLNFGCGIDDVVPVR